MSKETERSIRVGGGAEIDCGFQVQRYAGRNSSPLPATGYSLSVQREHPEAPTSRSPRSSSICIRMSHSPCEVAAFFSLNFFPICEFHLTSFVS